MTGEQYDAELARLRAGRDRLKALPAEPGRSGRAAHRGAVHRHLPGSPAWERGAWLKSHGFVIHAAKKEVSVIQGDVQGTARLG
jgi:hypothetical protein